MDKARETLNSRLVPALQAAIKARERGLTPHEAYRAAKQKLENLTLGKTEYDYAIKSICSALRL